MKHLKKITQESPATARFYQGFLMDIFQFILQTFSSLARSLGLVEKFGGAG